MANKLVYAITENMVVIPIQASGVINISNHLYEQKNCIDVIQKVKRIAEIMFFFFQL